MSRAAVETRSGIMKKDWQRLPTQLLHEWTQREKRPKAQYEADDDSEETEWRERVVLGDPKHPDRSLAFCPSEPSPTRELAREHAALLALLQVVVMVVVVVVVVVLEDL